MRALLLLIALGAAGLAQSPPPAGSVSGRVTLRSNGAPVRGGFVLAAQGAREKGAAWTDEAGRFRISGLAPGQYSVIAGKPGAGSHLRYADVRTGEETAGIRFALTAPGAIAGRVRDDRDLPVEGARIGLQGFAWLYGRPHRFDVAELRTDDRGEFRATARSQKPVFVALQPPSSPDVAGRYRLLHPPLFYPNAVNPAAAQPLRIEPGTKLETLDFVVPPPTGAVVRIAALMAKARETPRACPRCRFSILGRQRGGWLEALRGRADRRGLIEIEGLQPGNYRVSIAADSGTEEYAGYADLFVEAGLVRSEKVTAWSGVAAAVSLTLADPPQELLDETKPWTATVDAILLEPGYPVDLAAGRARIEGQGAAARGRIGLAPGEWALEVRMPGRGYVEQVLVAGRPQAGPFVTVSREGFAPPVEIRIGSATAKLSGKVNGLPGFDPERHRRRAFVFALPDPPDGYARREEAPELRGGQFEFPALAPGDYVLFALPPGGTEFPLDPGDPEVQSRYAGYGKRVAVKPGDSLRVELEAIP